MHYGNSMHGTNRRLILLTAMLSIILYRPTMYTATLRTLLYLAAAKNIVIDVCVIAPTSLPSACRDMELWLLLHAGIHVAVRCMNR